MGLILRTNPNYLRQKALGNNYADWLAPDQRSPKDLVATAYWGLLARQMEEMSRALGRTEDAEKYAALHAKIAERFDAMLAAGLVAELAGLRARLPLASGLPSMRCVGYRQAWDFLEQRIDTAALRARGIHATGQLAKRRP